uniref:Uncharacterized protein TCIL3000_8_7790 n=1 Tax=Trypanosoma congolense (strain IL3000) TaxID=1068625 RepID=G0UT36_TRYCI|nr:unnamed protein product [Trypanosoma congolense IL3000]
MVRERLCTQENTEGSSTIGFFSDDISLKQLSPITPIASTKHSISGISPPMKSPELASGSSVGDLCVKLDFSRGESPTDDGEADAFSPTAKPPFTEEEILEELEELRCRSKQTSGPFNRRMLPLLARSHLRKKWGPSAERYAEWLVMPNGEVAPSFRPELEAIRERRERSAESHGRQPPHHYAIPPQLPPPQQQPQSPTHAIDVRPILRKHHTKQGHGQVSQPRREASPKAVAGEVSLRDCTGENEVQKVSSDKKIPDSPSSPQTPQLLSPLRGGGGEAP